MISTSKSEVVVLSRKQMDFSPRVGNESLPQVKEFKYLGVLFTSKRTMEMRIGAMGAVFIFIGHFYPNLRSWRMGHDQKNETADTSSWMGFLRTVAGVSLSDKVRSSVICAELWVESLLLCVERSHLRWFGHLVRLHPGRNSSHVQPGGGPMADPGPGERLYFCTGLGTPRDPSVRAGWCSREREVWRPLLKLLCAYKIRPNKFIKVDWMTLWTSCLKRKS